MAVKKTAGKTTRVSPKMRDEGKKVASRKATSGTVSAATSKSAQKAKAEQLSKPGKVTESGMANIPASIMRLGKVAIDAYKKGQAAGPRGAGKPGSKVSRSGSTASNMMAKEGVKSGQLPKRFAPTNSPRKPSIPVKRKK